MMKEWNVTVTVTGSSYVIDFHPDPITGKTLIRSNLLKSVKDLQRAAKEIAKLAVCDEFPGQGSECCFPVES